MKDFGPQIYESLCVSRGRGDNEGRGLQCSVNPRRAGAPIVTQRAGGRFTPPPRIGAGTGGATGAMASSLFSQNDS